MAEPMPAWMQEMIGASSQERKPGEVHPKYPHLVRNEKGEWPMGSIPYNEELKAGLYGSHATKTATSSPETQQQTSKNDLYEANPDVFTKLPRDSYKRVLDYLDKYYSSQRTKEKLKAYFPDLKGEELNKKVDEVVTDIKSGIANRNVYVINKNNIEKARQLEKDLMPHFESGVAEAFQVDPKTILLSPDIAPELRNKTIAHEFGHRIGKVGGRGENNNIPVYLDEAARSIIQSKYTPKQDSKSPLSIRRQLLQPHGEIKPVMDEIRQMYNLDPQVPVTKEFIQKSGIQNNARWKQLLDVYGEDDLIEMMNGIVRNNPVNDFRNYVKTKNTKNV